MPVTLSTTTVLPQPDQAELCGMICDQVASVYDSKVGDLIYFGFPNLKVYAIYEILDTTNAWVTVSAIDSNDASALVGVSNLGFQLMLEPSASTIVQTFRPREVERLRVERTGFKSFQEFPTQKYVTRFLAQRLFYRTPMDSVFSWVRNNPVTRAIKSVYRYFF